MQVIGALRGLVRRVQRVMREVALGATGFPAEQAHRVGLGQQVIRAAIHMQHAVGDTAGALLRRHHALLVFRPQGEVIGDAQRVEAGRQERLIGHALHLLAIDEDARRKGAERVALGFGGDQHGSVSSVLAQNLTLFDYPGQ